MERSGSNQFDRARAPLTGAVTGTLVAVLVGLLWTLPALAAGEILFMVEPGQIWTGRDAQGQVRREPPERVTLSLPGEIFETPVEVKPSAEDGRASPQALIALFYAANLSGDLDQILELFVPGERAALRRELNDPYLLSANRGFFRKLKGLSLQGLARYQSYTLAIFRYWLPDGSSASIVLPLTELQGGFYQTNALRDDALFMRVLAAVRAGSYRAVGE